MIEKDPKKNNDIVKKLTFKSRQLIEQSPRLEWFQEEINRRLLNTPNQISRQQILDIMFHSARNELNSRLNHINELLDSIGCKLKSLRPTETVNAAEEPHT